MLTAVLILAGIVLLALGVVTGSTALTAIALGLGVVAVVLLLLPRGPRAEQPAAAEPVERAEPVKARKPAKPAEARKPAKARNPATAARAQAVKPEPAQKPRTSAPTPATPSAPSAGAPAVVLVVAGRHRFHRPGCELLEGKDTEQLAPDEAGEEGFTACSRCRPDTVSGRAAPAPTGAGSTEAP